MSPKSKALSYVLAPLLVLSSSVGALAQRSNVVDDARRALSHYDLDGSTSTDAIAVLTRFAATHGGGVSAREADAIRWKAAADLLILSTHNGDDGLRARLAEALGEHSAVLELAILDGLALTPVTATEDPAEDAELALTLIRAQRDHRGTFDWRRHRGLRRDALFVRHVRQLAERDTSLVAVLSELSNDPCRGRTPCAAVYVPFDAVGRRAVATLAAVHQACARLEAARASGEAFFEAIAPEVAADRAYLEALSLAPGIRVPEASPLPSASPGAVSPRPSVVVIVGEHRLRYGWVPSVRLGESGPELDAPSSPMLPQLSTLSLSDDGPRRPRALPALVAALDALSASLPEGAAVAVGVDDDGTPSEVLARVLLSLRAAGMSSHSFLARGEDGSARTVALRLATGTGPGTRADVSVRMRLGGFTYRPSRGPTQDIPRVPEGPDGRLSFDYETLRSTVQSGGQSGAAITFMAGVRSSALIGAAFAIATDTEPLTFIPY